MESSTHTVEARKLEHSFNSKPTTEGTPAKIILHQLSSFWSLLYRFPRPALTDLRYGFLPPSDPRSPCEVQSPYQGMEVSGDYGSASQEQESNFHTRQPYSAPAMQEIQQSRSQGCLAHPKHTFACVTAAGAAKHVRWYRGPWGIVGRR